MTFDIEFKITGLDEKSYNSIIKMLKTIKQAEIITNKKDTDVYNGTKEHWNPDWQGDHDDELRWKGW